MYAARMSRDANILGALAVAIVDELDAAEADVSTLTSTQRAALNVIVQHRGSAIRELADVLGMSHPGTVRLVDRLQTEGLVDRRPGPDARSVALHPTPAGRRLWNRQRSARNAALEDLIAALPRSVRSTTRDVASLLLVHLSTDEARAATICRFCDESECPQDRCPVALAAS